MLSSSDVDLNQMCRTCLSIGDMKSFYDKSATHLNIVKMLMLCTSMEYHETIGLPAQLCNDCVTEIYRSYKFIMKCRESESKLLKLLEKNINEEINIIKHEIHDEPDLKYSEIYNDNKHPLLHTPKSEIQSDLNNAIQSLDLGFNEIKQSLSSPILISSLANENLMPLNGLKSDFKELTEVRHSQKGLMEIQCTPNQNLDWIKNEINEPETITITIGAVKPEINGLVSFKVEDNSKIITSKTESNQLIESLNTPQEENVLNSELKDDKYCSETIETVINNASVSPNQPLIPFNHLHPVVSLKKINLNYLPGNIYLNPHCVLPNELSMTNLNNSSVLKTEICKSSQNYQTNLSNSINSHLNDNHVKNAELSTSAINIVKNYETKLSNSLNIHSELPNELTKSVKNTDLSTSDPDNVQNYQTNLLNAHSKLSKEATMAEVIKTEITPSVIDNQNYQTNPSNFINAHSKLSNEATILDLYKTIRKTKLTTSVQDDVQNYQTNQLNTINSHSELSNLIVVPNLNNNSVTEISSSAQNDQNYQTNVLNSYSKLSNGVIMINRDNNSDVQNYQTKQTNIMNPHNTGFVISVPDVRNYQTKHSTIPHSELSNEVSNSDNHSVINTRISTIVQDIQTKQSNSLNVPTQLSNDATVINVNNSSVIKTGISSSVQDITHTNESNTVKKMYQLRKRTPRTQSYIDDCQSELSSNDDCDSVASNYEDYDSESSANEDYEAPNKRPRLDNKIQTVPPLIIKLKRVISNKILPLNTKVQINPPVIINHQIEQSNRVNQSNIANNPIELSNITNNPPEWQSIISYDSVQSNKDTDQSGLSNIVVNRSEIVMNYQNILNTVDKLPGEELVATADCACHMCITRINSRGVPKFPDIYICSVCGEICWSTNYLKFHLMRKHIPFTSASSKRPIETSQILLNKIDQQGKQSKQMSELSKSVDRSNNLSEQHNTNHLTDRPINLYIENNFPNNEYYQNKQLHTIHYVGDQLNYQHKQPNNIHNLSTSSNNIQQIPRNTNYHSEQFINLNDQRELSNITNHQNSQLNIINNQNELSNIPNLDELLNNSSSIIDVTNNDTYLRELSNNHQNEQSNTSEVSNNVIDLTIDLKMNHQREQSILRDRLSLNRQRKLSTHHQDEQSINQIDPTHILNVNYQRELSNIRDQFYINNQGELSNITNHQIVPTNINVDQQRELPNNIRDQFNMNVLSNITNQNESSNNSINPANITNVNYQHELPIVGDQFNRNSQGELSSITNHQGEQSNNQTDPSNIINYQVLSNNQQSPSIINIQSEPAYTINHLSEQFNKINYQIDTTKQYNSTNKLSNGINDQIEQLNSTIDFTELSNATNHSMNQSDIINRQCDLLNINYQAERLNNQSKGLNDQSKQLSNQSIVLNDQSELSNIETGGLNDESRLNVESEQSNSVIEPKERSSNEVYLSKLLKETKYQNELSINIENHSSQLKITGRSILYDRILPTGMGNKIYTCARCKDTISNRSVYGKFCTNCYLDIKKNKPETTPMHQCEECDKQFRDANSLRSHMNMHSLIKPFICPNCSKSFWTQKAMDYHEQHIHTNPGSKAPCPDCDKIFQSEATLRAHQRFVHEGIGLNCIICDKKVKNKQHLRQHMEIHIDGQVFTCMICDRKFQRSKTLRNHLTNVHYGGGPYTCHICNKQVTHKFALQSHMQSHEERSTKCDICGKLLKKASMYTHMLAHANIRRFECTVCDKKFKLKDHLTLHLRTHSNERAYACSHCDFTFKLQHHLKAHVERKHPSTESKLDDSNTI